MAVGNILCLLFLLLTTETVYSFSACDEIDITFVIDADSVLSNSASVIKLITKIIWSGSSEHSGFSAVIYGNNIPQNQKIKIISLHDTKDATQRQAAEQKVDDKLNAAFENIKFSQTEDLKSIGLVASFKIATGQSRPDHKSDRKRKLGYDINDKSIGDHDNQQVYIIFDHKNKLLNDNDDDGRQDMCALFDHLDNNAIKNDDEAPYFMFGHKFNKRQILKNLLCDGRKPEYVSPDSFYHFAPRFAASSKRMEAIYCLTCPAQIKSKSYDGTINVGNHVQYIDRKTVIECSLRYVDNDNNVATPDVLDRHNSFIKVKDFVNDDNTFKLNDYLIANTKAFEEIKQIGCKDAVYKITAIKHIKDNDKVYGMSDSDESNDYKILKLYVRLPTAPMEYMSEANIRGDVPIKKAAGYHYHKPRHKRRKHDKFDESYANDDGEEHPHKHRHYKNINKHKHERFEEDAVKDSVENDEFFFKAEDNIMKNGKGKKEWMDFDEEGRRHALPPEGEESEDSLCTNYTYQLLPVPAAPDNILSGLNKEPMADDLIPSILEGFKSIKHVNFQTLIFK